MYRALGLMMAASPCALAVAPLAYAIAISSCARKVHLWVGAYGEGLCFLLFFHDWGFFFPFYVVLVSTYYGNFKLLTLLYILVLFYSSYVNLFGQWIEDLSMMNLESILYVVLVHVI